VLTAGIAHTFNNLVSTILAHADLAGEEITSESPAYESVTTIATVALRASEIVNLLMAYAGQGDSDTSEPVELSSLIRTIIQLLKVSMARATLLNVTLSKEATPIWANPGQIRQVVLNLVVNASEALGTQPGTVNISTAKVRVRRGSAEPGSPDIPGGEYVLFEVSDDGCGMSEETQSRIFDPFFSTKTLGRGLGLASVQGIVRGAGGAINVASSPGNGSTFRVWLPIWNGRLDKDEGLRAVRSKQSGTVLLVDDEARVCAEATDALEREGYAVITASDGVAVIELFERHIREIEAVVIDRDALGLSSQTVCDEISRMKPSVGLLFTSAGDSEETNNSANGRFLPKPYRLPELVQALREIMIPADAQRRKP